MSNHKTYCKKNPPRRVVFPYDSSAGCKKTIVTNENISDGFIDISDECTKEVKGNRLDYYDDNNNDDGESGVQGMEELLGIDQDLTEEERAFIIEKTAEYAISVDKSSKKICKQNDSLEFRNYQKTFEQPYCFFIDFESYIHIDSETGQEIHTPCGFASQRVSNIPEHDNCPPFLYSRENVMQAFFAYLEQQKQFVESSLSKNVPMNKLTEEEELLYQNATHCDCCAQELRGKKCRNHSHQTGVFINILCNSCNLQYKNASRYVKKWGKITGLTKKEKQNFSSL